MVCSLWSALFSTACFEGVQRICRSRAIRHEPRDESPAAALQIPNGAEVHLAQLFLSDEIESPLDRIPEICIEVLSGNRAYDRVTKRYLYAEAGVAEYWIVDPAGVVERRSGPELGELESIEPRLTSLRLPGFALDLAVLFAHR